MMEQTTTTKKDENNERIKQLIGDAYDFNKQYDMVKITYTGKIAAVDWYEAEDNEVDETEFFICQLQEANDIVTELNRLFKEVSQ